MAALSLHEWMVKHGVDQTVLVLGGDSTNENTGWHGAVYKWLLLDSLKFLFHEESFTGLRNF